MRELLRPAVRCQLLQLVKFGTIPAQATGQGGSRTLPWEDSCLCRLEQLTEQKWMLQPGHRYGASACAQT